MPKPFDRFKKTPSPAPRPPAAPMPAPKNPKETPLATMEAFLSYGRYATVMRPLCIFARALHTASGLQVGPDAHSFVSLVVTAYGGGILVPLALGGRPTPLMVDAVLLSCLFAVVVPFKRFYGLAPIKVFGLLLEAMFRCNLIANFVVNSALPSRLGPIAIGFVAGIGGMFLSKGIIALKPLPKPALRVFLTSVFIAVSTSPAKYAVDVRPLAVPTATALMVAINGVYDVLSYLLSDSILIPPATDDTTTTSSNTFLLTVFALLAGGVGFNLTEGLSPLDSVYLSALTVSTVGLGDLYPTTPLGKLISVLLMTFGATLFAHAAAQAYAKASYPYAAISYLAVYTMALFFLEDDWELHDAAYFVLCVGSTVGYGDLAPKTDQAKGLVILFAFVASPALADLTATLAAALFTSKSAPKTKKA